MTEQVEIKSSSKETVALSLAQEISTRESLYKDDSSFRENFLNLYAECLKATKGQRKFNEPS